MMREFGFFLVAFVWFCQPAAAKLDERAKAGLKSLDPKTRLEQVCDLEAMDRIGNDKSNNHEPDRALGEVTAATEMKGDTLIAKGGAVRSHSHWYKLSYICKGSPDHMKVLDFSYKIGERIPESQWEADSLWK